MTDDIDGAENGPITIGIVRPGRLGATFLAALARLSPADFAARAAWCRETENYEPSFELDDGDVAIRWGGAILAWTPAWALTRPGCETRYLRVPQIPDTPEGLLP